MCGHIKGTICMLYFPCSSKGAVWRIKYNYEINSFHSKVTIAFLNTSITLDNKNSCDCTFFNGNDNLSSSNFLFCSMPLVEHSSSTRPNPTSKNFIIASAPTIANGCMIRLGLELHTYKPYCISLAR